MNLHNEHSSRHLRLRWHLSANALQLKALKLAPPNSCRRDQYRQLDYERALLEAELRLQEEIDLLRKYDPDQPREPAGTPEGGQWISVGGSAAAGRFVQGNDPVLPEPTPYGNAAKFPLLRFPKTGLLGGLITAFQFLNDPEFAYPLEEALDRYNSAVAVKDNNTVPSITFRAHAFDTGSSPQRVFATMKELERDEARKLCPKYTTVQTQTDIAAFTAGPRSTHKSPATYGTAVHTHLEHQIRAMEDPDLRAERSYMKYHDEMPDGSYERGKVTRGRSDSIRIDVLERTHRHLICVYDIKTGPTRLSLRRIKEISYAVAKNFGKSGFTIIEMRPGRGALKGDGDHDHRR
ncbi:hypothetical protein [Phyllobacterium myrsinacearum]|uniref:Uncharacterized protein n=1 Tax=Phyllobacterium myrsinacearum TaxID=28101 RepID=A0A2S9JBA3_9HYPH|nr:hypothetical protein [Phyllobacterium myrsinacearum]PRD50110.1 hypothetical protein C5750_22545 [Phyllobacterium myrsinacearum]PWV90844.1 hypothetical protein DEV92_106190 [Phyllobacterium myrsinacearum]RZU97245.1 hypothetical protein EV654_4826 [Phyllobacterium myrsinacearum]